MTSAVKLLSNLHFEIFGFQMNVNIQKNKLTFGPPSENKIIYERNTESQRIKDLADEIAALLNSNDKRRYIISLLTTRNSLENNQEFFTKNIRHVALAFGISKQELEELNSIAHSNFPPQELFCSSIIAGNCKPELVKEFNGLRFFFKHNCPAVFWIYKMESSHYVVVKTLANESLQFQNILIPGTITLLDETVESAFRALDIKVDAILSELLPTGSELFELTIPQTDLSPLIHLDPYKPKITISGRSIMLDADAFYLPVFSWLSTFRLNKHTSLDIHFAFDLLNTKTCRMLASLFFRCKKIECSGVKLKYYWVFPSDDTDLKQLGIEMQSLIEARFEFIETEVYE